MRFSCDDDRRRRSRVAQYPEGDYFGSSLSASCERRFHSSRVIPAAIHGAGTAGSSGSVASRACAPARAEGPLV